MKVEILYRDEHMVAVSKPAGLLVHRSALAPDRDVLLQRVRDCLGRSVYTVHRIDRPTSGVVLLALSSEVAAALQSALTAADKRYLAIVRGVTPESGTIDKDLGDLEGDARRPAITDYVRLEVIAGAFSLLAVHPRTGRRHQIRRHLSHIAHQVLGDTTYGKGRINRWLRETQGLSRIALHAERIDLRHPVSGEPLEIVAPLPSELEDFLRRLRTLG